MQLAISGQLLGSVQPLGQILELFRSLDIAAIEIWPSNVPALPNGDAADLRGRYEHRDVEQARRLLHSLGCTAACVTLSGGTLKRCTTEGAGVGTTVLKEAVDAAATLGAKVVNCYLAGLAPALFVAAARPAAEYAGRHGITIVLENEAHDDSGTARSVRSIVEAVDSPHFGTLFDACNYYQAGEEAYPYAYEVLKPFIRYAHLKGGCQYRPDLRPSDHRGGTMRGASGEHIAYVPIADGAVNIDGMLHRLARDGYQGFVTLEPHVPPAEAAAYYRQEVPHVRSILRRIAAACTA
jgi:sugar phosphate isomerase/epimerase